MLTESRLSTTQAGIAMAAVLAAFAIGLASGVGGAAVVLLPLALAAGLVLWVQPVIGLFLFAAMIPVEATFMVGGRSVAALIGMAVVGIWVAQKLVRRDPLLHLVSPGLVQVALLLLAFGCVSLLWAQYPQAGVRGLILLAQLVLLSLLVLDLASSWGRLEWIVRFLVLAGLVAALLTMEQYFLGGARRAGAGVTGGLNRTARTLVTILPFAFYLFRADTGRHWRLLGLGYVIAAGVAVVTTLSRMNYLLFPLVAIATAAFMLRTARGRRQVFVLAGCTIVLFSLIPADTLRNRAESIGPYLTQTVGSAEEMEVHSARGFLMRIGVEMFKDRPIIGSGYDNYRPQTAMYQWRVGGSPFAYVPAGRSPHSSHISFLVGLGVVGLAMWVALFLAALVYLWKAQRHLTGRSENQAILVQSVLLAVALQLPYGFYDTLHEDKVVWLLLGMALAARRLTFEGQRPPRGAFVHVEPSRRGMDGVPRATRPAGLGEPAPFRWSSNS